MQNFLIVLIIVVSALRLWDFIIRAVHAADAEPAFLIFIHGSFSANIYYAAYSFLIYLWAQFYFFLASPDVATGHRRTRWVIWTLVAFNVIQDVTTIMVVVTFYVDAFSEEAYEFCQNLDHYTYAAACWLAGVLHLLFPILLIRRRKAVFDHLTILSGGLSVPAGEPSHTSASTSPDGHGSDHNRAPAAQPLRELEPPAKAALLEQSPEEAAPGEDETGWERAALVVHPQEHLPTAAASATLPGPAAAAAAQAEEGLADGGGSFYMESGSFAMDGPIAPPPPGQPAAAPTRSPRRSVATLSGVPLRPKRKPRFTFSLKILLCSGVCAISFMTRGIMLVVMRFVISELLVACYQLVAEVTPSTFMLLVFSVTNFQAI
ncbi:hypothetical protein PAPYR_3175 [Paratrimastix pyriformis]|uniref:THH1/TOM1/TOM3 domain-containing protein n=1 Tax=Paratrimastix pyriformis TaxID=342808 RepID=A0ABQ8UT64_9EUKA|nr:hypothetical protein PAPYR_3175 [Paratrimastix pyriformis]